MFCFSNSSTLLKFIYKWSHRPRCSTKYYYTVYYTQASVVQITTACTRSTQLLHLCTFVLILTLSSPVYYNSPIYWGLVRRGEAVLYSVWTPLAPTRSASLLQSLLPSPFIPQNAHHACTLHVLTCGWFARRADDPYLVYLNTAGDLVSWWPRKLRWSNATIKAVGRNIAKRRTLKVTPIKLSLIIIIIINH